VYQTCPVAYAPTQNIDWRLFDDSEAAVVDGEVADDQSKEQEVLQLGQVVVTQFQVEYDFFGSLQLGHRVIDVLLVRELAQDIEAVCLDGAHTCSKVVPGWALVVLGRNLLPPPHQTYPPQHSHKYTATAPHLLMLPFSHRRLS
jgi:hypothetical protein